MESTEERISAPSFMNYKQFTSWHLLVSSVPYGKNQYLVLVNFPSTYTMHWLKYVCGLVSKNLLVVNGASTYTISHLQGVKLLRKKYPYKSVLFSGFFNIEINFFDLFIVPGCYVIAKHDLIFKEIFTGCPGQSTDGSVCKHSHLSHNLPPVNEQQ